jgi:hypothetical protein
MISNGIKCMLVAAASIQCAEVMSQTNVNFFPTTTGGNASMTGPKPVLAKSNLQIHGLTDYVEIVPTTYVYDLMRLESENGILEKTFVTQR